jgi:hypothetical protein
LNQGSAAGTDKGNAVVFCFNGANTFFSIGSGVKAKTPIQQFRTVIHPEICLFCTFFMQPVKRWIEMVFFYPGRNPFKYCFSIQLNYAGEEKIIYPNNLFGKLSYH